MPTLEPPRLDFSKLDAALSVAHPDRELGAIHGEPPVGEHPEPNSNANDAANDGHDYNANDAANDYAVGLPTWRLILELRRLLASGRRTERLICRYLADLADRVRQRSDATLDAYADELHAARCFFGLGARDTRERVRVGRALRQLPQIEQAFVEGQLAYSRVREVTRVATAETELLWLQLAERLDMRALERRVAGARELNAASHASRTDVNAADMPPRSADSWHGPPDHPARIEWTSSQSLRVTFELSAEGWALIERALHGARRASGEGATHACPLGDGEALQAIARDALAQQTQSPDASDPRRAVVLYECQRCGETELDTGKGGLQLEHASAAALGCGATEYDLRDEGRAMVRGGPLPAAVRRAVLLRDRACCRVPSCNRRRYVDVHHLTAQAHGGEHSRRNCLVLCTTHHRLLHEGKLSISGDADQELQFQDALGQLLAASRGPSSPFQHQPGANANASQDELANSSTRHERHDPQHCATQGGSSPERPENFTGPELATTPGQTPATVPLPAAPDPDVEPGSQPGNHPSLDCTDPEHMALKQMALDFGFPCAPALRLLRIMGRRGGWTADALSEASGLRASDIHVSLTLLELAGRVRSRAFGFDPV
jgi:DprA/Smf-like nucleotide binding protein involved in DNA uptake